MLILTSIALIESRNWVHFNAAIGVASCEIVGLKSSVHKMAEDYGCGVVDNFDYDEEYNC
jgi:hypothetical protein